MDGAVGRNARKLCERLLAGYGIASRASEAESRRNYELACAKLGVPIANAEAA